MDNEEIIGPIDSTEIMSLNTKTKVSCYTQVEPEFVGTVRSIVGQYDIEENCLSKRLQDINLEKQNKGIRPPLVGQASSSSNDSVSQSFEKRLSNAKNVEQCYSPQHAGFAERAELQVDLDLNCINFTRASYTPTPYLLNRDDYINQRPPEGSSEQTGMMLQPAENIPELPRIRSTSSASSVMSSKPLEWDSGADVGYNQLYVVTGKPPLDPEMSTIERMALACGTNLLTRSDPEGTTAPSGQPQPAPYKSNNQAFFRTRNKFGYPNAESTPVETIAASDVSPDILSEDYISPILYDFKKGYVSDSEIQTVLSPKTQKILKSKIPLFPEIIHTGSGGGKDRMELDINISHQSSDKAREQNVQTECKNNLHALIDKEYVPCLKNTTNRKLSSSLENVCSSNIVQSESDSNTLHRSQSQSNIHTDQLTLENIENRNTNSCTKYNMALHNLIQHNKSASSSSVATVVHRKGDSPKNVTQRPMTLLSQESVPVGIQICDDFEISKQKVQLTESHINKTPHLPKSILPQQFSKRSNYFNFDTVNEKQNLANNFINTQYGTRSDYKITTGNDQMLHSHNGVLCTGAHKRVTGSVKLNNKLCIEENFQQSLNNNVNNDLCLNVSISHSRPTIQEGSFCNVNGNKLVFGTGTLDSVESSAKSGGCWTDKQYSVTVEDRVNSFEYLPGHMYENTERQELLDSQGTSSISIKNPTSNNETQDEQIKISDSSANASSTLEKDVQIGLDMFLEFVNGSCANDPVLKNRLIRQIVKKITAKNYAQDKIEPVDLASNIPWVPSTLPNPVERNGRETRRAVNRSKVPCEFSSRSEKSGSTNASSECFIPRPKASNSFLPSSLRDNSYVTGQHSNSSTSEISLEKSSKNHIKPHLLDGKTQLTQNDSVLKEMTDSSSNKTSRSSNWREPVTKYERLFEERRKLNRKSSDPVTLTHYLNKEREFQHLWIHSQIKHLNNLKELMEKQEELKREMKCYKLNRQVFPVKSVLRDRNRDRNGGKEESSVSRTSEMQKKNSSPKQHSKHQPTLSAGLENIVTDLKTKTTISSAVATDVDQEGWTSHHYGNNENLRSCMKSKNKYHSQKADKKIPSRDQKRTIYDEPPLNSLRERVEETKLSKQPSTPYRPRRINQPNQNVPTDYQGLTKKNANDGTPDTVGVQMSNSVQLEHKCHCTCQGVYNCYSNKISDSKNVKGKKSSVGYYIMFESCPTEQVSSDEQQSLEEVQIPMPMSEPKKNPSRHLRSGLNLRENEKIKSGINMEGRERMRSGADIGVSEEETASTQTENDGDEDMPKTGKLSFQGAPGTLQYYLLLNRPSYVSRAEDRRQCIAQMQHLRELREHSKRRLLSLTEPAAYSQIPPPPLRVKRVFSQQTMRRLTEKKYRQLAEVKGKQLDTKKKEKYRTNRLMAEIFNKKLQKRVLKGEVNLSNSVSIISNL